MSIVKIKNLAEAPYRVNVSTWNEAGGMTKKSIMFIGSSFNLPGFETGITEVPKAVWNKMKNDPRIARRLGKELVEL